MMFDDSATFRCAYCGEANEVDIDLSAGRQQSYVEDCQVCCQPNLLEIRFDTDGCARVAAEQES